METPISQVSPATEADRLDPVGPGVGGCLHLVQGTLCGCQHGGTLVTMKSMGESLVLACTKTVSLS